MPGTVIGTKDTEGNKANKTPSPNRAYILVRKPNKQDLKVKYMSVINAKEKTKAEKEDFNSSDSVIPAPNPKMQIRCSKNNQDFMSG